MTPHAYPDVEQAVRAWLRAHPKMTEAGVGSRVFFGLPQDYDPARKGPAVGLPFTDEQPVPDSPLVVADVQADAWAGTKAAAAAVRRALVEAFHDLDRTPVTIAEGTVILHEAHVTGSFFSPDTTASPALPRYVTTVTVTASLAA